MAKQKRGKVSKFVYWTPRIASIVFLCFLALMSFDVFSLGLNFWQTLGAIVMHNMAVFILAIVLLIAWKYEIVGGIAFILGGLLYITQLVINAVNNGFEGYMISWAIQIAGVAFFIGILFLINWYKKK